MEWRRHAVWGRAGWDSCVDCALHKCLGALSEQAAIQLHLAHRASPKHKMATAQRGFFLNWPFLNWAWQRADAEQVSSAVLPPGFKGGKGLP